MKALVDALREGVQFDEGFAGEPNIHTADMLMEVAASVIVELSEYRPERLECPRCGGFGFGCYECTP